MNPSGGVRKLVQVSEEMQKPIHVPVVMGNECFIITQQDCRKIEDIRVISYHKVGPNGELIPIEASVGQDVALNNAIMSAAAFQTQNQVQAISNQQLMDQMSMRNGAGPVAPTKATIAQQMEWSAANSTSPAYPFTYTKPTSATDISARKQCPQICCCCRPIYVTNQSCNTIDDEPSTNQIPVSAREKLKIRKMTEDVVKV